MAVNGSWTGFQSAFCQGDDPLCVFPGVLFPHGDPFSWIFKAVPLVDVEELFGFSQLLYAVDLEVGCFQGDLFRVAGQGRGRAGGSCALRRAARRVVHGPGRQWRRLLSCG